MIVLQHISDAISKVEEYIKGLDEQTFKEHSLVQDGVIRQIEIIGEATKHLSPDLQNKYPTIPWKDIAGMRNKLIHDYFGIDIEGVWDTVKEDIPNLKNEIILILKTSK